MDQVITQLKGLTLTSGTATGLVYHPETLQHTVDPDPKRCTGHVENPLRVQRILTHLQQKGLVDRCDFLTDFGEIDPQLVANVHGEDYLDYLTHLWPEGSKKTKMTYTDTYYNSHTTHAAFLAAEGTRLSLDRICSGRWRNAFALVRPPGHHAAAKENRIQGFCMINNVVVAIRDVQARYGPLKVAILDWDIHHGDASQKQAYEDPSILYISIHKYQNGAFYPGSSGNVNNVGKGPGEGFNLNFPFNVSHRQAVGDPEYIYVFERAILPVLKEYRPDLIVVSCGFDCLINDPLGLVHVTQNGLSYLLLRMQQEVTQRISVVLEGGYNLQEMPVAAECLLRVLLGEYYPNSACRSPSSRYQQLKTLNLNQYFLANCDENFAVWKKYWKCLEDESFEKRVKKIACDPWCVPNKHKYSTSPHSVTKLGANISELVTYRFLEAKVGKETLEKLMPPLLEATERDGKVDMAWANLNPTKLFALANLVIPNASMDGFVTSEVFQKFRFFIRAYQINDEKGEVVESRRNHQVCLSLEDTFSYFGRVFHVKRSREAALKGVQQAIDFLDNYLALCAQHKFSFVQPRLLIFYDDSTGTVTCRFVNVGEVNECLDNNTRVCVAGVKDFLGEFRDRVGKSEAKGGCIVTGT